MVNCSMEKKENIMLGGGEDMCNIDILADGWEMR